MVGGEIDDLLRRPRALEREGWLSEHRATAGLQFLQAIPGVCGVHGGIVAANAVLAEGLGKSCNLAPVELHARTDDEIIIGQSIAVLETNRILFRLEALGGIVNPTNADGDQAFFRTTRARQRIDAGANQR